MMGTYQNLKLYAPSPIVVKLPRNVHFEKLSPLHDVRVTSTHSFAALAAIAGKRRRRLLTTICLQCNKGSLTARARARARGRVRVSERASARGSASDGRGNVHRERRGDVL